jgi:hypothetical protein
MPWLHCTFLKNAMLERTRPYRKLAVREIAATAGSHKSPAACSFTIYRSYCTHHTVIK